MLHLSQSTKKPRRGACFTPVSVPLCLLPGLVFEVCINGTLEIVACLLEVQLGHAVIDELARRHDPPNLALAQLLGLALNGPRRKADASLVEVTRDEDCLARQQQVVAVDLVGAAQGVLWHAVAQRQREDAIVLVVEKVQRIVGAACFLVLRTIAGRVWWGVARRRRRLALTSGVDMVRRGCFEALRKWIGLAGYLAIRAVGCEASVIHDAFTAYNPVTARDPSLIWRRLLRKLLSVVGS